MNSLVKVIKKKNNILIVVACMLLSGLIVLLAPSNRVETWFTDLLYIREKPVDNRIKIIGIDEQSLREMGPFQKWSRQQAADLLNSFDKDNSPSVVAFDINYFGHMDEEGDAALVKAASEYKHIVMASYLEFSSKLEQSENGDMYMNTMHIEQLEKPYEELEKVTHQGFTNVVQDNDNYVRRSLLSETKEDDREYNFAYAIYSEYMDFVGEEIREPVTKDGVYGFDYTARPGAYEIYSYSDIVNGRVDTKIFKDSIVLVGAYCAGMMDQYMAPIAKSTVMNGVEVQANHLNALLSDRTYIMVDKWLEVIIVMVLVGFFLWFVLRKRIIFSLVVMFVLEVLLIGGSVITYNKGLYFHCFNPFIFLVVIYAGKIIASFIEERVRRQSILKVFRKYMAPQVVDELSKDRNFKLELGGRNCDIAVLFVDIRGFTTLSESLSPEVVVGVLNCYLKSVTEAVFKHGGMIDKFIGDAVMAVYNAPLDLEDYQKKAVLTGIDIVDGIAKLNESLKEQYNVTIGCGVGIHCGRAVVGNIGSDYRMDYTAIGDTVNISERLESIAKAGEVLISREVKDKVDSEFKVAPIGEQSLKGKHEKIEVYHVEGFYGTEGN